MRTVEVTKRINAEPGRVFELLADFEGAPDRISGIESLEVLTDGPVGVGTRFKETRIMFGKEATETMEIIDFVPGTSYSTFAESCGCEYISGFTVIPAEGGCDVRMDFNSTPKTLMAKVLSVLMAPMMKMVIKCVEQDLEDIKNAAESGQAAAPES